MHSNNDLTRLSKTGKICKRAIKVFELIRDEIIDEFGVSSEFLNIHKANINLELLRCELIHTGDRSLIFHIQIEEKLLNDMIGPMKIVDMYEAMAWLKKSNINFDEEKISTFWFLKYLGHITRSAKLEHGRK